MAFGFVLKLSPARQILSPLRDLLGQFHHFQHGLRDLFSAGNHLDHCTTNAFGAAAAAAFAWAFFAGAKASAFDVLSFISYPSKFKWSDPTDVFFFLFFLILFLIGIFVDYRRDLAQRSPGFGEGKDEGPAPRWVGTEAPGIDLQGGPPAAAKGGPSEASSEASEPFLIFPDSAEKPGGIRRNGEEAEKDSNENSETESVEQDDEFVSKWIQRAQVPKP
ncbi:hypothetical protein ENH_00001930 [Eimeria necatrix]|uniref:Uncharacterized protein n=1 Tax=Eimeria necatrix TaxID=51315 RepID=U6MRV0_9EIME|nr:hypothetical protein ENH_00001930 [Eimeria necatrix]CDJ65184.1 hypothetical protein ENH_00001930 [Eimeria necatrix]